MSDNIPGCDPRTTVQFFSKEQSVQGLPPLLPNNEPLTILTPFASVQTEGFEPAVLSLDEAEFMSTDDLQKLSMMRPVN